MRNLRLSELSPSQIKELRILQLNSKQADELTKKVKECQSEIEIPEERLKILEGEKHG
jgi:flagellar biosynthesis chaperone FliJ